MDIWVGAEPWECCDYGYGTWQVAQECVHLLDPVEGGPNCLEEGLASWFQNSRQFHNSDEAEQYIKKINDYGTNYQCARALVCCCMPQIISAVKEIRSSGTRIGDITTKALTEKLNDVDRNIIERFALWALFFMEDASCPALASGAKSIHSQGSNARLRRPGLRSRFFCFPDEHIVSGRRTVWTTKSLRCGCRRLVAWWA